MIDRPSFFKIRYNYKTLLVYVKIVLVLFFMQSCKSTSSLVAKNIKVVDVNASKESKILLSRINSIAKHGYAFGHQDATAYGLGWKYDEKSYRSDVNDVARDFPAVYGFEIGHIELGHEQNLDTVNFKVMKTLIKKAHKKGGIITISWHPDNPLTNDSAWDNTPAVPYILSSGVLHAKYRGWLSKVADFLNDLKEDSGKPIPIVLRPFHEMNGSWFWWGEGKCKPEEYQQLWRETVQILTNEFRVHNVLYAYSTDTVKNENQYLRYYPGDEFVDILGIDIYHKRTVDGFVKKLEKNISILKKVSLEKKKPYAISESGLNMIPIEDWWTQVLDKNISDSGISWILFWRNAWKNHHYAPYKGQKSSEDFKKFKDLPHVLFLNEVKKIKY